MGIIVILKLYIIKNIDSENGKIVMQLASRESATGRPEEVLDALNIPYEDTKVERTGFLFKQE